MSVERIIGIDFGTSTSVIRVKRYNNGQPIGDRLSKQAVIFNGDRPMVPTLIQRTDKVTYYGYDALIPKKGETLFQNFKVDLENLNSEQCQEARVLTEEFFTYMAKEYRSQSDNGYFGDPSDTERTIVSYPVKWGDETKAFLIKAAKKAGFKNVEGMDEAQAAIHAVTVQNGDYLMKHGFFMADIPCNILLIDMGAGTTDLVLCRHTPGKAPENEMICTWPKAGNILFGGKEVDEILRKYVRSLLPGGQADIVLKKNGIKEFKIWKETVVSPALARDATVEEFSSIDNIVDLLDIDMKPYDLDRSRFEKLAEKYLAEFPRLIAGCIDSSGISKKEIDLVILTGGHSQWYFVKKMLCEKPAVNGIPTDNTKIDLPKIRQNPDRVIPIIRPQETVALGMIYKPLSAEFQKKVYMFQKKAYIIEYYRKNMSSLVAHDHGWIIVKPDGTIACESNVYMRHILANWDNIVSISGASSEHGVAGVKRDGTVVTTESDRFNAQGLRDIVSISQGGWHTVGLRKDGTVEGIRYPTVNYSDFHGWRDIVSISCGFFYMIGLRKDGTVVATGIDNEDIQSNVRDWRDIVSISCGRDHAIGLRKDGIVVATGSNVYGRCDVQNWRDIVSISCGSYHTIGLRKDGTVVATGYNGDGQCDVQNWRDIIAVCAVEDRTCGMRSDGTIIYTDYKLHQTLFNKIEGVWSSVPLGTKTLPWKLF